MAMRRYHFFMATGTVAYERDGAPRQKTMNVMLKLDKGVITNADMAQANQAIIGRLHQETGVPVEDVRDFWFLGFSPLGQMTEAEFYGEAVKKTRRTI